MAVAFHSMSIPLNLCPQLSQTKLVIPLNISLSVYGLWVQKMVQAHAIRLVSIVDAPFLFILDKGKEWVRQKLSEERDFITF